MKFSVLMSVYHKENPKYLSSALESVINQSLPPVEIILVKDGPLTDDLNCIISRYCSEHKMIRTVGLLENRGLAYALNKGLEYCSCDLIARMDSDDISEKNRFELQIKIFQKLPDIDVVGTNISEFEGDNLKIIGERRVPQDDIDIKRKSNFLSPMNHATVMFKKQSFQLVNGYNEDVFPEDYYLWLKMINKNIKFYNIQQNLLFVRVDNGVIARRSGLKYLRKEINFFRVALREDLIPLRYFLLNVVVRSAFRILPVYFLQKSYMLFFRK